MLDAATMDGFIANYRGVRTTKDGREFWIEDGVVWQLVDHRGVYHGTSYCLLEMDIHRLILSAASEGGRLGRRDGH